MAHEITVLEVDERYDGRTKYLLSLLSMESIVECGFTPDEAIIGTLTSMPIVPESFVENTRFVELLHSVVASFADDPDLVAEARRLGNGTIPIRDLRLNGPGGSLPLEEIIGAFAIESGRVVKYHVGPKHRLLNQLGFFELSPRMYARLMSKVGERCKHPADASNSRRQPKP